jgi:hypothetical protein
MTEQLIFAGIVIMSVIIGYVMGFKAARPDDKLITRDPNMGPTEDDGNDLWSDAMQPIETEERVETR